MEDIGANACIARGSLEDRVISEGTKMDQLVHISHNVKMGKYCLITNSLCTFVDRGQNWMIMQPFGPEP